MVNRLTSNDPHMGRTAPLTSKHFTLYIYSTNIGNEYFKSALYSPFFSLQNAVCFIMLTCLVAVLFTFYIQGVLKLKIIIPARMVKGVHLGKLGSSAAVPGGLYLLTYLLTYLVTHSLHGAEFS